MNRLIMFVCLCLAQVLILNHVHLFQVATPLLYVYFVITFRRNFPRWIMLLASFFTGLLIDICSSTPGLAAFCLTLIAFVQPLVLELFVPRDSVDNLESSAAALGWNRFATLSAILTVFYCLLFFGLESFSFFNWFLWLGRALASAALTLLLLFAIELVRSK